MWSQLYLCTCDVYAKWKMMAPFSSIPIIYDSKYNTFWSCYSVILLKNGKKSTSFFTFHKVVDVKLLNEIKLRRKKNVRIAKSLFIAFTVYFQCTQNKQNQCKNRYINYSVALNNFPLTSVVHFQPRSTFYAHLFCVPKAIWPLFKNHRLSHSANFLPLL